MPVVPTYNTPQVAPTNLPDVRQQTPYRMMQAGEIGPDEQIRAGQALQSAGKEGMAIATQNQIQQNEAKVKEYDANLMGAIQGVLYGTPDDPSSGYLNQKGGNAVGDTYDKTVQKLKDLPVQQGQDLSNPAQQEMAKNTSQLRIQAAITEATKHNAQQTNVYQDTAGQTRIKVAQDGAPISYNPITDSPKLDFDHDNPDQNSQYQQYLATVKSEASDLAARRGYDADTSAQFVKDQVNKAYVATISHLLDGKKGNAADSGTVKLARDYFDKVKDELPADQQDKIKSVLDASAVQDKVLSYSDKLFDSVKGEAAQLKQVRADFEAGNINGKERELIESRVNHQAAQQRQQEDKWTASAVGQAQDFILKNPGKGVMDLPRNLYLALESKGHLAALDSFANREINKPTDPIISHNLYTHFGDGSDKDIGKLSDTEWVSMKSGMSPKDWLTWDQRRTDLQSGDVSPGKDPGNLHTQGFNAALNNRMISIGINPSTAKSDADKERVGAIQDYAAKWVISEQQAAGKRFNQQETQQSLDKLFATNINFRSSFLGVSTGTSSQRMMTMTSKDLPSGAYDGIKQDLIRGGNANPTDRDIMLQYWSLHGRH